MACDGLEKGRFHLFVCTPNGLGSFLEQHIFGPCLTHFLSHQNSFSRHFGIYGPKMVSSKDTLYYLANEPIFSPW